MTKAGLRSPGGMLELGTLAVDADGYRAWYAGRPLDLSRSQLELLAILIANAHRVVSRIELSSALGLVRHRSVDVMLSLLRKELGVEFVRNVRNRGWILAPELLEAAEER